METDPLGRQTNYGINPRGQIACITLPDPDGNGPLSAPQITRSFNARGDLVSQTDAMGKTTTWNYNARRQVLIQTDPDPDGVGPMLSPVTSFTYDLAGKRTSVTDPVGNITSYCYDHAGRLVEEIDPRGRSTFYHYNPAGEVTRVVDRNSRKRDFTYNNLGLVTQEAWVDGFGNTVKTITHVYDDAGREVSSADGVTGYQYQYDLADRVIQVDNAGGVVPELAEGVVPEVQLDFQYDFEGNRTWMGDSLGGAIGYTWGNQRLQSMRMTTAESKSAQVDFGHESVGRLSSISRMTNDNPATTIDTAYTLDLLDRVTSITHQKVGASTSTLSQFSYSYDATGRVNSYTGPEGSLSFAQDANGQLLSVTGSRPESYAYDANGNRSTNTTGTGNLVLNDSQYINTYDFEGNRKTRTRLSDGQITEYYWDHRNQLTLALVKNANGVILKELRFTYDVAGRRVGVWTDADGAGPLAADQIWTVFDGANPYMDLDPQGNVQERYLYGPGIDELFARIGAGEDPEWYLTDRLGSIRQIVDGSGSIQDEITYDSYGNILSETNPAQGDRFKFTGREFSPELGIYYYRARWYDPATGQFISQDPIGFRAGDPNLYRYVGNGPGDATDPLGLARILLERTSDGRMQVSYQGSWIFFDGSPEFVGYLDPKDNSVERNGKRVSLSKLERIASSWWGFKPDWNEYFKENGYDPNSGTLDTYFFLCIAMGLYPDTFINDFAEGMGQITDFYENAMWHYAGAGFMCSPGGAGKVPVTQTTKPGNSPGKSFSSFDAFKYSLGPAGKGKVWHHIVEQRAPNVAKFGADAIHNTNNLVSISWEANQALANYYSSIRPFSNGMTVRQWLGTQSFAEQDAFGRRILKLILSGGTLP